MYINKLTVTFIGVLQGGRGVECTSPSERVATVGSDYDWRSTRDGIGVDGKWYYQQVCGGASRHRSVRTGRFSV